MTCAKCGSPLIVRTKTPAGENIYCCPNQGCPRYAKDYVQFAAPEDTSGGEIATKDIPWHLGTGIGAEPVLEDMIEVRDDVPAEKPKPKE